MHSRWLTGFVLAAGIALTSTAAASASTTTTTAPRAATATAVPKTTVHHYEVISGTFAHRANAVKHLNLIRKDKIAGLSIARIGTKTVWYRVEERGLSRAGASARVKQLHDHGFTARYVLEG